MIAYCKECEYVVEGSTIFIDDGLGDVECCPCCDEPVVQLPEDDPRDEFND